MTKQSIKTENRISTLEANYTSLEEKIDEIKNNHLVHLTNEVDETKKAIAKIDNKLAMWAGGIVVAVWFIERFLQ